MGDELRQLLIDYMVQKGYPRTIEPHISRTCYRRQIPYIDFLNGNPLSSAFNIYKTWLDDLMPIVNWTEFHNIQISTDPNWQVLTAKISQGVI